MYSINCNGNLLNLESPKVMGILNITPDSFYDGGNYNNISDVLKRVEEMLVEGATIIDVGAYSSRPRAKHISENEESQRIIPVIKQIVKTFPKAILSVDTFRSAIAKNCILEGACIINDISAGNLDKNMFQVVAQLQVPYIMMHMQGIPQNMQNKPVYEDVVKEVFIYFSKKINEMHGLGVNDIVIDLGFGFGKTLKNNYDLLKNMTYFKNLEKPILAGLSRKSMLFKPLEISQDNALNATTAANTVALLNGASILRVHDVKEAIEAIKIVNLLEE